MIKLTIFQVVNVTRIPKDKICNTSKMFRCLPAGFNDRNFRDAVLLPKNLVHQRSYPMDVIVADLDEAGAAFGEEVAGDGKPVA